jgi:hypothetical protein
MIAIENQLRINHDPVLIAESDPGLFGKIRSMEVSCKAEKPEDDDEKRLL